MPNLDRYGNPIESSVISPYHPANNRPHHGDERNSTYTFRQRSTKLNLTLGWELEANRAPKNIPSGIEHISDGSVDDEGAEFVVLPAVTKSPRYVLGLLKDLVHAPRLNTNKSCGFHVHVSASNLSSLARMRQWAIATEHLALQVEDLAFKAVPDSRRSNQYCKRITPLTGGTSFPSSKYNNGRRYYWLNTVEMFRPNGIRTIEVRLLGHTHRWKYLLAWSLFSMELARRGWDISNRPFEVTPHVDALSRLLINMAKDIKPLEKKLEPIPQWVYTGLKDFGIEANAWERPLARLSEKEADINNLPRRFYSDEQAELPSDSSDDDGDYCECGCGEEGRCNSQLHSDRDCDSNYCDYCHEDGNCSGSPDCERCRDNRHDEGEDCGRRSCSTCHPTPRPRAVPVSSVSVDPIDMNGVRTGRVDSNPVTASSNVTIHASNMTEPRAGTLNIETVQAAVNIIRNQVVDNHALQMTAYTMMRDSVLYGRGVADMVWVDEAANEPPIDGLAMERRALNIIDGHELSLSLDREQDRGVTRALTVAEIERLNNQGGR